MLIVCLKTTLIKQKLIKIIKQNDFSWYKTLNINPTMFQFRDLCVLYILLVTHLERQTDIPLLLILNKWTLNRH